MAAYARTEGSEIRIHDAKTLDIALETAIEAHADGLRDGKWTPELNTLAFKTIEVQTRQQYGRDNDIEYVFEVR